MPHWTERFVPDQPSMDDRDTPSPPIRTVEEYEADCAAGIQRIGKPLYGNKKGKLSD